MMHFNTAAGIGSDKRSGARPAAVSGPSDHAVLFYEHVDGLADAARRFLEAGLRSGQAAVIIATAPHTAAFRDALAAADIDVQLEERHGRLTFLDAHQMLAQFLVADMPDEARFLQSVGALIGQQVRLAGDRGLRAYGEMVDVLWQAGNAEAAIRLEELWHDLARAHPFSLLCAYAIGGFYGELEGGRLLDVCRLHTHVLPGPGSDRGEAAPTPDTAITILQQSARSLEAELEHRRQLEVALRAALAERRRTEELLRQREEDLRDFLENAVESLHWVGPDGTIQWANQAELELLGYARDEYIGHHIAEFHVDRAVIDDILARLWRNESLRNYPARMRHKDGSIRHVLINSSVLWRNGEFVHTRCFTRDVTALEQTAARRARAERYLQVQFGVTRVMAEAASLAEAAPRILEALCESTGSATGSVWLVDESAGMLRCVATWGGDADEALHAFAVNTREMQFAPGVGLPGRVWSSGHSTWITDVSADRGFSRAPFGLRAGLHGAFAFPIRLHERTIGVVECFCRELKPPDESLLQLVEALGDQIGQFTERRDIEATRAWLAAIVDSSDDAIIGETLDGYVTSWNRGAERILGYTASEAIGRHISFVIPEERYGEEETVLGRLRRGERLDHFDTVRQAKDGRLVNVSLTVSPIHDADGRVIGASKVARDITERLRAEHALREQDRLKDEFLATLAHELRNPLAPIRTGVQLIRRAGNSQAVLDKTCPIIERQLAQMVRLVDDLLDVSRISRNKLDLRKEWADLGTIVQSALETSRPLIEAAGHALTVSFPAEPVVLDADSVRLAQAFSNLLNNAAKYTNPGGRIWLTAELVREGAAGEVIVRVRDNGVGIPADQLAHIFDMFVQVDPPVGRADGGLGLGLTLARRLIQMHGGTLTASSGGSGQGSEFSVRLPVAIMPAAPLDGPLGAEVAEAPTIRRRVLVVDDNRDSVEMMSTMLDLLGHEVMVAHDGREAIEQARLTRPDIAFLDLGMPRVDGYEAARRIREDAGGRPVLLVAVTGWGQTEDRRRSSEAGFDAHLVKPVDFAAIQTLLDTLRPPAADGGLTGS